MKPQYIVAGREGERSCRSKFSKGLHSTTPTEYINTGLHRQAVKIPHLRNLLKKPYERNGLFTNENIYTKTIMTLMGEKAGENKFIETKSKLPCLVMLLSPHVWCGEPTVFRYLQRPKTSQIIPMWGVGLN